MTPQINPGDLFGIGLTSDDDVCIRMFLFSTEKQWGYLHYFFEDGTVKLLLRDSEHQPQIKKL